MNQDNEFLKGKVLLIDKPLNWTSFQVVNKIRWEIKQKFGFKKITQGHGSFLKGKIQENLIIDNFQILPLICYEIIFTELTQNNNFNLKHRGSLVKFS